MVLLRTGTVVVLGGGFVVVVLVAVPVPGDVVVLVGVVVALEWVC